MYILTQLHITVRSSLSPLDVKILENFFKSRQSIAKGNTGIKILTMRRDGNNKH